MNRCRAATVLAIGFAQASAQPLSRTASVVAGGGGTSANAQFTLTGTVGQPGAGIQSDGHFALYGGFWPGYVATQAVVLEHLLVWTNTHGGKWSVASNWRPNAVPGPADSAVLDLRGTYTVTMDAGGTVSNLTLAAGVTLAGANPLAVLGALTWTGGKISARVQCSGGTVSGADTHTLSAGRLVNGGRLQLTGPITTAGAAIITNLPGAVLELAADVGILYSSGTYGAIINQGTLRKTSGAGLSQVSEAITSSGMIEARSGTLALSRPCVQTDGATLVMEGQLQVGQGMLLAGGRLTGTNLITGAVTNSGGLLAPGLSPGGLTIDGRYVQTSGGTLAIEVAGADPGTGFDVLTVLGAAKLGGTLQVSLLNGYSLPAGIPFEFLSAASCLSSFEAFTPALEGLGLALLSAPDHVALIHGEPPPHVTPSYTLVDLGGLATDGCSPQAINARGQVVGFAQDTSGYRAFLWDQGKMTSLGTLAGANSHAYGINDTGHVAGWSTVSGSSAPIHAFFWDGTMHDLGTLDNGKQSSQAYGINNHDEIIGYSGLTVYGGTATHPFLYRNGSMLDLHSPFLPGNNNTGAFAYGLNDRLQVVGQGPRAVGSAHGFLYDYVGGSVLDVGDLGGANGSVAWAINARGLVTGWAVTDGNLYSHAFLFDGRIHDLGTLGGWSSQGFAINALGQIVGRSDYENGNGAPHAFLYTDGRLTDLNKLLPADSGWTLREATGINDAGQIVGNAYWHSMGRGFLLTPQSFTAPSLRIEFATDGSLALSWSSGSTGFVLQENAALLPTGWTEIQAAPAVVGTELRLTMPRPVSNRFYRLRQP